MGLFGYRAGILVVSAICFLAIILPAIVLINHSLHQAAELLSGSLRAQ